jgi:predicted ATPase/DNA-binding SARP family transcriptional activator
VEFRILGPLEVLDEGRPIALGAAKQRALLGALLLHANEVVSAERLVDELWGERPPATAYKLIQGYVSELRKALRPETIETRPPGYVVRVGADDLDLTRFRLLSAEAVRLTEAGDARRAAGRFREALALWRGRVLADVSLEGTAQREADQLDELRVETVSNRIEAELFCGLHVELVGQLEALVAEHPLRERPRGQLMLALYRSGRQAEALAVYRETRRLFQEELGIDPGRELQELERAILNQDAALDRESSGPATNLPIAPTPLIGRERELAEAFALLREHRLVTLTGPGGVGKTRLALQLAADAAEAFPDGVVWVPLQALRDPDLVEPAIAQAVRAKDGLIDHLRRRHALLALDNFEQVADAATGIGALLAASPRLKVLVTSRASLNLAAEQEYRVPPLAEPGAVALFVERARSIRPDFEPSETVAAICRRLDCLPLAVELAAARVRAVPEATLLDRLERRLPILTGGPRDAPERQQTLRATIAWSYELLESTDRRLFARLGVFAGGCELEAAEQVCDATLDGIQSLVDSSLLSRERGRLSMLETVREYALEQLDRAGELDSTNRRHADYFVLHAERADREVQLRHNDAPWIEWLEAEHDNLHQALSFLGECGDAVGELRLAAALAWQWYFGGYAVEGRRRLEDALARTEEQPAAARAYGLSGLVRLAMSQGDDVRALQAGEECLRLQRQLGDGTGEAWALVNLAGVYVALGDHDRARMLYDDGGALFRRLEDPSGTVTYLNNRGNLALVERDYERAVMLFEEGLATRRRLGWRVGRTLLANLGFALLMQGRIEEAQESYRCCLETSLAVGGTLTAAYALEGLAAVDATSSRDDSRAARLFGAAAVLREEIGIPLLGVAEAPVQERALSSLRKRLGDAQFSSALAEGRGMSLEEASAYALAID